MVGPPTTNRDTNTASNSLAARDGGGKEGGGPRGVKFAGVDKAEVRGCVCMCVSCGEVRFGNGQGASSLMD